MRVMHVLDHSVPLQSGYAFRTLSILREQRARGWETVHVTSTKHATIKPVEESHGFRFHRTRPGGQPLDRLPVLNQWAVVRDLKARLRELVRVEKPDILHAHSPCLTGLAALPVGRQAGIPVVYEMRASWEDAAVTHGTTHEGSVRYRVTRALETRVLRRADAVTTICEGLRADIAQRGIPESKITVIPNAVDLERFPFEPDPDKSQVQSLGVDLANRPVLGFIGSLYRYEGLDILLRAMPRILSADPATVLLIVGGGPEEQQLKALAQKLDLGPAVIFTGRVPHAEVGRYYAAVDVFVYPRLSTRLTDIVTPLKPLEAMARGRVVIASDVGGHKELIRDGVTGKLFRAGEPDEAARAVAEVLGAREQWPAQQQAARRFVEEERSWPASVARYEPVYRSLVREDS